MYALIFAGLNFRKLHIFDLSIFIIVGHEFSAIFVFVPSSQPLPLRREQPSPDLGHTAFWGPKTSERTSSAGRTHQGALHWDMLPRENSRRHIRRLPGEGRGEAGLHVVSTVVQLCDGQDSQGSNQDAWRRSAHRVHLCWWSLSLAPGQNPASTCIQDVLYADDLTLIAETGESYNTCWMSWTDPVPSGACTSV